MTHRMSFAAQRGFTLVELVVAIMITGIIAGFVAMMTTAPVNAYLEQSGRTELNDTADIVAHALEDDLARAIPNSVSWRNSGARAIIELVKYEEVVFYRADSELAPADAIRDLSFALPADDRFATYGRLYEGATGSFSGQLVIGNLGRSSNVPTNRNIYRLPLPTPGVMFPSNRSMMISDAGNNERRVQLSSGFQFINPTTTVPASVPYYRSPATRAVRNRMFRVGEAVTYICNSSARTLRRYSGYSTRAAIPTTETAAQLIAPGVTNTLVADNVSACLVRCWASDTNVCQDTLAVQIEFNRASVNGGNDRLRLHKQYRMDNDL